MIIDTEELRDAIEDWHKGVVDQAEIVQPGEAGEGKMRVAIEEEFASYAHAISMVEGLWRDLEKRGIVHTASHAR